MRNSCFCRCYRGRCCWLLPRSTCCHSISRSPCTKCTCDPKQRNERLNKKYVIAIKYKQSQLFFLLAFYLLFRARELNVSWVASIKWLEWARICTMNDIGGFRKVKSDARIISVIKFLLSLSLARSLSLSPSGCLYLDVGLRWGKMKPRTSITCRNVWLLWWQACLCAVHEKIPTHPRERNGMECKCTDKTHSINAPCTTTRYFLFLRLSRHSPSFFVRFTVFFSLRLLFSLSSSISSQRFLPFRFIFFIYINILINKWIYAYVRIFCGAQCVCVVLQVANEK